MEPAGITGHRQRVQESWGAPHCRTWAVDLLSDSVMGKQQFETFELTSEVEEQQNIHSVVVLGNVWWWFSKLFSIGIVSVTTYYLVTTRFF